MYLHEAFGRKSLLRNGYAPKGGMPNSCPSRNTATASWKTSLKGLMFLPWYLAMLHPPL